MEKRDTIGKVATQLMATTIEAQSPIDLEREIHKDYEKQIYDCIERGKKEYNGDFYIVVIYKKERLLPNVVRSYYTPRYSCPTPEYDQTVYKYIKSADMLEFLWVIPSKDTCELLRDNALNVAPAEKDLLQFVLEFYDGTLFARSKRYNNEQLLSPFLVK